MHQATQSASADADSFDLEDLIYSAAELKGHQMVMGDLVRLELANRLTYDDLPEEVKQKVERVREAANPKLQPAHLADQLIQRWRSQQAQAA